MTDITTPSTAILADLPLIGWLSRTLSQDTDARIWAVLLLVLILVAAAVVAFGIKALGLIALASVPAIYLVLILLTVGK